MVIVRAPIHNYRVGVTRSLTCYLCLDANQLESLRLHFYFIRSSHVTLFGCLFLTIKSGRIFPSTPSRLWTRSSPWTTSCSASRKHQIWRSSSEVNGRREDNVLRDNPRQLRRQEVQRREVGARRQIRSARRASPRLNLCWSSTARRRIINGVVEPTLSVFSICSSSLLRQRHRGEVQEVPLQVPHRGRQNRHASHPTSTLSKYDSESVLPSLRRDYDRRELRQQRRRARRREGHQPLQVQQRGELRHCDALVTVYWTFAAFL